MASAAYVVAAAASTAWVLQEVPPESIVGARWIGVPVAPAARLTLGD